ncbi:MAG: outer membrane lipoprotein-sorting protein [Acidobacteriota bacterium]
MRLATLMTAAVLLFAGVAGSAETPAALVAVRNRIETSDYRATGQLVRVDAGGSRTRFAISVEGLWLDGALHTLIEAVPSKGAAAEGKDEPLRLLLEARPDGRDSIRILRPNAASPLVLPPGRWGDRFLGTVFSYEDLLDPQFFWPKQTLLGDVSFDGRRCDLLKSVPGRSDRTSYSEVRTWLDHSIAYPVHAEKTLRHGGAVKEITYYGLRQSNGVWSATQIEAKMRGQAGSAIWIIKRGSAKAHLDANDFQPGVIGRFEDRP